MKNLYTHVKTQRIYELLNDTLINATNAADSEIVVLYRDVKTKQQFVRNRTEFFDGRFEKRPLYPVGQTMIKHWDGMIVTISESGPDYIVLEGDFEDRHVVMIDKVPKYYDIKLLKQDITSAISIKPGA